MNKFKSMTEAYEDCYKAKEVEVDVDVVALIESLVTVNEGYGAHLQQLVEDIRAEKRDKMVMNMLGEFGAMMAERGYERAQIDIGGRDA